MILSIGINSCAGGENIKTLPDPVVYKDSNCKPEFSSMPYSPQVHAEFCKWIQPKTGVFLSECMADKAILTRTHYKACLKERSYFHKRAKREILSRKKERIAHKREKFLYSLYSFIAGTLAGMMVGVLFL